MMKLVVSALCVAAVLAGDVGPEKVTVNVKGKALDSDAMKGSMWTNQYCMISGFKLNGVPYRSRFAPDLDQCLSRCNRDFLCKSADFTDSKICNLHKSQMPNLDINLLGLGASTHYHRRSKLQQSCPVHTEPIVNAASTYSQTFCTFADKKCPGHNLYKKSQRIGDMTKCMEKCVKIKSCASADYINSKCAPKDYACMADELVEESGATFMLRLAKDESECPAGSKNADEEKLAFDCPKVGNTNPIEKPGDCDNFYQCSNGVLHTMPCAPGTAFNPAVGVCDWPKNVPGCGKEIVVEVKKIDCAKIGHTKPFEKPGDCDNFYQCDNGVLHTRPCPPGTAFNPAVGFCMRPKNVPGCGQEIVVR